MSFNLMEPKLAIYRVIMAAGVVGFFLSLKINYFPTGWICILSAIFTAIYLWEELMCSTPDRRPETYDDAPGVLSGYTIPYPFKNEQLSKFILFLFMPFFVWHITSFGGGYLLHQTLSHSVVKEYVVSPVMEVQRRGAAKPSIKIKDVKTYTIFAVPIPKVEYQRIKGMKDVHVEIETQQSIFGLSFPTDFQFKIIKK